MAAYRWITIVAAAASAALCAFAIYFNVMALVKYRTDDFLTATSTKDFTTLGTCVEFITNDQLKGAGYDKSDIECNDANKDSLRNTLAVSVHGIYYAYYAAGVTSHTMQHVAETVLSTALNKEVVAFGVNFSVAYDALQLVSEQAVPTAGGCESIYGLTKADLAAAEINYMNELRGGRLDDDGKDQPMWPSTKIPIVCNEETGDKATTNTITVFDDATLTPVIPLADAHKRKLYAHCVVQFEYASSGTPFPHAGTFGVPLPGEPVGPAWFFYPNPDGFNSTTDSSTKARIFLGQRFGFSVWAYIPMLLATCYLCADAVVFFLAEATLPDILLETQAVSKSQLAMVRDSLVLTATSVSSRRKRFAIGLTCVLVSYLFYGVFVVWPWGFIESRLPRPICEAGEPDHVYAYTGTTGGWKSDWDVQWYELATLATQLLVLFLLPLTTTSLFEICNRGTSNAEGRAITAGISDTAAFVSNKAQYRRLMGTFFWGLLGGSLVMIAGQAVSGARFGMAWAEGVIGKVTHTDADGVVSPAFNEVTLSEQVYDQTIATVATTIVVGLVLGAALQRHLISGVGCFSAALFFAWAALIIIFALPLLVYASVRSLFNPDEANKDCAAFPDSGYDISKGACEARFWTFLAGGGVLFGTILLITVLGLFEALPNIAAVRNKASVRLKKLRSFHSAMRNGRELNAAAPFVERDGAFDANKHALGGFRSFDEGFFNYKTKVAAGVESDTDQLLYAPRVTFSLPVQGQAVQYVPVAKGTYVSETR